MSPLNCLNAVAIFLLSSVSGCSSRTSLLGSINTRFLNFARDVLYLKLVSWWPRADGLKTAFQS